jgi:hypothetical protein
MAIYLTSALDEGGGGVGQFKAPVGFTSRIAETSTYWIEEYVDHTVVIIVKTKIPGPLTEPNPVHPVRNTSLHWHAICVLPF